MSKKRHLSSDSQQEQQVEVDPCRRRPKSEALRGTWDQQNCLATRGDLGGRRLLGWVRPPWQSPHTAGGRGVNRYRALRLGWGAWSPSQYATPRDRAGAYSAANRLSVLAPRHGATSACRTEKVLAQSRSPIARAQLRGIAWLQRSSTASTCQKAPPSPGIGGAGLVLKTAASCRSRATTSSTKPRVAAIGDFEITPLRSSCDPQDRSGRQCRGAHSAPRRMGKPRQKGPEPAFQISPPVRVHRHRRSARQPVLTRESVTIPTGSVLPK